MDRKWRPNEGRKEETVGQRRAKEADIGQQGFQTLGILDVAFSEAPAAWEPEGERQ